jgi:hypothetical protein
MNDQRSLVQPERVEQVNPSEFPCDALFGHSAKDKAWRGRLAERLRQDGLAAAHQRSTFSLQPTSDPLHRRRRNGRSGFDPPIWNRTLNRA